MNIRKLQTCDLFSAIRLLKKIGVREEIKEVAKRAEESKEKIIKTDMGFDLFFGILEKAAEENAETEVYKFIADLFGCTWEEVREMNPIQLFKQLGKVADFEEWKSFFKHVAALMKKK